MEDSLLVVVLVAYVPEQSTLRNASWMAGSGLVEQAGECSGHWLMLWTWRLSWQVTLFMLFVSRPSPLFLQLYFGSENAVPAPCMCTQRIDMCT